MTSLKTVALAGASGSMGSATLEALIDAGFIVTVLTRSDSSAVFPSEVRVAKVDYDNLEIMTAALKGQDALISTVGYPGMMEQLLLIDAAIIAGVKRIIPSEYGSDPEDPRVRGLPVFQYKVQTEQHVKQKTQGTETSYSLVCNNQFFDWDLDNNFGVDIKNKKIEIFDDGEHQYTATPVEFVAKGIVGVLQHPERTANRAIRLHGATMSQNKLLTVLQHFTGEDAWEVSHVSSEEREIEGYAKLKSDPSNMWAWAIPFLQVATFGKRFGNNFSSKNDNELLGMQELSEAEIEEVVRSRT